MAFFLLFFCLHIEEKTSRFRYSFQLKMNVLRLSLRRFSSSHAASLKRADPRLEFDFIPATEKDLGKMVDLCCSDFIHIEPHSRVCFLKKRQKKSMIQALGMTSEESRTLFEWIVGKSLHYPYSMKILEKSSGDIIGLRTMSIGHRDHSLDWEPFTIDEKKLSKRVQMLSEILDESKGKFWKLNDDVNKVLRREITFVLAKHQKKGIARHLVHLGLDFDVLRAEGIQGIVSEASSIANQTLLKSEGYQCLVEPQYDWAKKMDDGTEGIKVFFKDLRL